MTLLDNRVNPQATAQTPNSGIALGQEVAVTLLRKQLDQTKVQGAAEVRLLESVNPQVPPPTYDRRAGTIFSAYA